MLQHQGGNLKSDQEEQNSLDGDGDRKNQTIALKTDQKEVTMKRRLAQDKSMMELLNINLHLWFTTEPPVGSSRDLGIP